MTDPKTIAVYDAEATRYEARFSGEASTFLSAFLSKLGPASRILDLGCGPGTSGAQMAEAGHSIVAIDASEGMIELARAKGLDARLGTFETARGTGPFDGIWANFSLLHAPLDALPDHLTMIHRELTTGGIFHIGMKTGEGQARDSIGRLYTYLPEEDLADLITKTGFSILSRIPGRSAGLSGEQSDWVVMLARKI